jgi:hypothetical protein
MHESALRSIKDSVDNQTLRSSFRNSPGRRSRTAYFFDMTDFFFIPRARSKANSSTGRYGLEEYAYRETSYPGGCD